MNEQSHGNSEGVTPQNTPVPLRPGYIPAKSKQTPGRPDQPASASEDKSANRAQAQRVLNKPQVASSKTAESDVKVQTQSRVRKQKNRWYRNSPMATAFFMMSLLVLVGFCFFTAVGSVIYVQIANELPDVGQLRAKRSTFASSKIYDRYGNFIVEITDPNSPTSGKRTYVPISQINEWVIKATTSTEDPNFYRYTVGFDPVAIVRVFYYLATEREFVSGGSTITQQVARNLLLSAKERSERTFTRKLREIVLANEMSRRYKREEILEIYLNEINYGNLAYGIQAASETYFKKNAKDLTMAESALLAGLPQAPSYHDPVASEQRALRRLQTVLGLMEENGYITSSMSASAYKEIEAYDFKTIPVNIPPIAPHFMNYLRQLLDEKYGKALYEEPGLKITSSFDPKIQAIAEQAVKEQIAKLKDKNVNNGSVVAIDPRTGEVLAMVGSADFYNTQIRGQVNVALSLRQPGSTIKPFTYLTQMETRAANPATLYWDVPVSFRNQYGQIYTPKNYDDQFHGPMLMREALARSMNIPAVVSLYTVGITDFLKLTDRVGIHFPPNPQYGLAITLGGAEARLIDMTAAYAAIANQGKYITPTLTTRVERLDGKVLFDVKQVLGKAVMTPEHAFLLSSILSDNTARTPTFGPNSALKLSRPAAVKTGTTNDYRDNLAIGFSPDLTVGVWTGNTDNTPMKNVSGVDGAAPIWNQVMSRSLQGKPALDFVKPNDIIEVEICLDGGRAASPYCPANRRKMEYFKSDQGPFSADERAEYAFRARDQTYFGQLVRYSTPAPNEPTATPILAEQVSQPSQNIVQQSGIFLSNPPDGSVIGRGLLSIMGTVNPPGFERYQVEWGVGDTPADWRWISGPHLSPVVNGQLTQWGGLDGLPSGRYAIRVTVFTTSGTQISVSRFELR